MDLTFKEYSFINSISIQNISFVAGRTDPKTNKCCIAEDIHYTFENCEFTSKGLALCVRYVLSDEYKILIYIYIHMRVFV